MRPAYIGQSFVSDNELNVDNDQYFVQTRDYHQTSDDGLNSGRIKRNMKQPPESKREEVDPSAIDQYDTGMRGSLIGTNRQNSATKEDTLSAHSV